MRESLAMVLRVLNLPVECFASAHEFLANYDGQRPGCLLLDVRLPGMSGVELHEKLVRDGVQLPTIFITGHGLPSMSDENVQGGILAVFEKPYDSEELLEAVRKAIGEGRSI